MKNKIDELVQYAAFRKSMEKQGRSLGHSVNMNLAFLGNPGTAKTTVARLFARIMKEKGILSKGNLIEVGRADLIAKYTGQTAIKVQKVFEKAEGNVLFIDEAYSLVDGWENEFGDEAIATMVQEMENRRNDMIVIFAGYPDKMETFLSRNPGLRSRVPSTVLFEDYTEEELVQITETEARSRGYCLAEGTVEWIRGICREARKTADFGNGRFCRNLVDAAEMRFAARMKNADSSCPERPYVLHLEVSDFEPPAAAVAPQMRRIGFAVA